MRALNLAVLCLLAAFSPAAKAAQYVAVYDGTSAISVSITVDADYSGCEGIFNCGIAITARGYLGGPSGSTSVTSCFIFGLPAICHNSIPSYIPVKAGETIGAGWGIEELFVSPQVVVRNIAVSGFVSNASEVVPVPLPASLPMALSSLGALAILGRRRLKLS